jgi:hypothetical protein
VKISKNNIVILLDPLSCVRAKIEVLRDISLAELWFLWLIPPHKVLLLFLIKRQDQLVTRGFKLLKSKCFNPLPYKVDNLVSTLFLVPYMNQFALDCLSSMPSTILKQNHCCINAKNSRLNRTRPVGINDNSLRIRFVFRARWSCRKGVRLDLQ